GTAIITANHAGLWTDSRYYLQAEQELSGTEFELHKLMVQTQAEYVDWICKKLRKGSVIACDFWCYSITQIAHFKKTFEAAGLLLKDSGDLLLSIWLERPPLSLSPIYEHDIKYAGVSRSQKIKLVRDEMKKQKADWFLVSALDEIAHVLNLRGSDVHCNPVFVAYLCIGKAESILFTNPKKISKELLSTLEKNKVIVRSYDKISVFLKSIKDEFIWIDPSTLNAKLSILLPQGKILSATSCIMQHKAIKNSTEIKHIRRVMEKDAIAIMNSIMWLEEQHTINNYPTEFQLAEKLIHFRSKQRNYVNESFNAIVGYNSNGAIIHYRPEEKSSAKIRKSGILLIDSGGQYLDGTTDITRTIKLGAVKLEIKRHYTAVLMGHIALARAVFPRGTKGVQLDVLARQFLWKEGLNYNHGTGHGVGFFMNVHEPPQGFVTAYNQRGSSEFVEHMLTSNEPGYYEEGSHGIRIENLVLSTLDKASTDGTYLAFETVTLFPIDTSLIVSNMMDRESIQWLNQYHQEVYRRLSRYCNPNQNKWLKEKCKAI
ncbi:MAG: aminopeptidase family protein P, partial [Saprospiraceae bacterium]